MLQTRPLVVGLLASGLCAASIGCGSSDGGSGGDTNAPVVDQAKQEVAKWTKEPTGWPGSTESTKVPAGSKKIVVITCTQQAVGCAQSAEGVAEASKVLGWSSSTIDGKADPSVWNSAVLKAVASKADGIITSGVPSQAIAGSIAKAKDAGIPVVSANQPKIDVPGVVTNVNTDIVAQGTAVADWLIADSDGKAELINLFDPEDPQLQIFADSFSKRIKQCGGCKVHASVRYSLATMATQLPQAVSSSVSRAPQAKYINANLDSPATFVAQGLAQAGKAGKLEIMGYNGDPDAIERIRKGQQAVTVTTPETWVGFESVNQIARALSGQEPNTFPLPSKLITKDNAPEGAVWDPEIDYRGQYRKLWGR
jgi:ribose transport system substrate-binding protein